MSLAQAQRARFDNDVKSATKHLEAALAATPNDRSVWREIAATMVGNKDYERATSVLTAIHEAEPGNPEPCYQLATAYDTLGDWTKALEWISAALRRLTTRRGATLVYTLYGDILYKLGEPEKAARMWDRALATPNQDGPSLFAKAEILLARGEWSEGWKLFEARWHTAEAWRTQKLHQTDLKSLPPEWDGVSPGRVLVCAEQGSGDVIQMLRYVELLSDNAILQCQPEILPFVRDRYPWIAVVANGERITADYSCPIMSLPLKLGVGCLPGLLRTTIARSAGPLRVGVCWQGSKDHGNDKDRSSPIDFRTIFADVPNVEVVSLQHGEPMRFRDFLATAEVIETCDVVVTVDTSVLHLAGTLGVPTYVIPPARPELRFPLTHADTTPWYPSVRVVRRRFSADWPDAIARVVEMVRARSGI